MPTLFQPAVIAVAALMTPMAAFQAQADLHSRAEPFNAASAADIDQNYLVEVGVASRGFDTLTADVTYDYVYRYTVDTNRDVENDFERGWVLKGVRVTFLQRDVAELCT